MGSMLTRAIRHAPEGSPLRSELREVNEIAQSALDNVRGLSQSLHPSVLDELGLESAIDTYLAGVERQLGLKVTYERVGAPLAIDPSISIQVYRVLQEALTNVARHAGAGEATVRLTSADDTLELVVEDNGRGMAPAGAARAMPASSVRREARPTTGMASMRERAALVGGTLEVESPATGGTRVRLRVPITDRQSAITNQSTV
jgi:signal transduction histidine kinase